MPHLTAVKWMKIFWWLRIPMKFWVQTKIVPREPVREAGIDPEIPVCFVTPSGSFMDLLVLDDECRKLKLPRPKFPASELCDRQLSRGFAGHLFLSGLSLFQADRDSRREILRPLTRLVEFARENPDFDVQLVPVSVFWGRNPGKGEQSLFQLLFFDDEHAGVIQKFFIVLVQGRNVLVQFGRPIMLQEQVRNQDSADQVARKLSRVMRVYFRTQRYQSVGPALGDRRRTVETILRTKSVRSKIDDEVRRSERSVKDVEREARGYGLEIAADVSYPFIRAAEIALQYLWQKMFSGLLIKGLERVNEAGKTHELVYMPSHRSHIDYLLLGQSLYSEGYVVPHTAAGINLNFWPVGDLLRKVGAFYIRRTFSGNKLYAAVFGEYVHHLITSGFPVKFFPEGGRSRSGKLLPPKTGFLSMVVQSFIRNSSRPVALVPIYLGYDRVWEAKTYASEVRGAKKKSESIGQLLRAVGDLRKTFGSAYLSCAKPLDLGAYLDQHHPGWREEVKQLDGRPPWVNPLVQEIAQECMFRINAAAVLGPVSVLATALLAVPNRALGEDQLVEFIDALYRVQRDAPLSEDVFVPPCDARKAIKAAEKVDACKRLTMPGGDVIYADEEDAKALNYYSNMTSHLFVIQAIVARLFQNCDQLTVSEVKSVVCETLPFLRDEFFIALPDSKVPAYASAVIEAMDAANFLEIDGRKVSRDSVGSVPLSDSDLVRRPAMSSNSFIWLQALARVSAGSLDRIGIGLALLGSADSPRSLKRSDFELAIATTGQRLNSLRGLEVTGAFDRVNLRGFIDSLVRRSLIVIHDIEVDAFHSNGEPAPMETIQQIVALPELTRLGQIPRLLLGTDMASSIARTPI